MDIKTESKTGLLLLLSYYQVIIGTQDVKKDHIKSYKKNRGLEK